MSVSDASWRRGPTTGGRESQKCLIFNITFIKRSQRSCTKTTFIRSLVSLVISGESYHAQPSDKLVFRFDMPSAKMILFNFKYKIVVLQVIARTRKFLKVLELKGRQKLMSSKRRQIITLLNNSFRSVTDLEMFGSGGNIDA